MKFKTRLTLSVMVIVLVTMTVIAFGMQRTYSDSFSDYLAREEESRLKRIVDDIGTIARTEAIDLTSPALNTQLQVYARDSNINITIMDLESSIVANYRGLKPNDDADIQVDQYRLINGSGAFIGSMLVTYDRSNPALAETLKTFQSNSLRSTIFGLAAFVVIAFLLSSFVSKQITDPIAELGAATEAIRQQNYNVSIPDSDIQEIQMLAANVQYLASSLRQQDAARRSYAQDISHELRTPLTNLQLHIEAMRDGVLPVDEKNLDVLDANIAQLTLLVERLKNTFREASLVAAEDIHEADLSHLTHRILDSFEPRVLEKEASLTRDIEADIRLQTDERLYSQVLANLLSNAAKAIDREGHISVHLASDKRFVTLRVVDDGVGIDSKDIAHLFDRFYRVDSSRNRVNGGQGLGLSITKNIVQQLGGRIDVTSKLGKGTAFRVQLPHQFFHDKKSAV
ncbi:MAG: ATP-binding protein [Peptoniphilaceae bacterium]|nr:ATP-binding protein [Peptoniphilaceae bacterium]MDY6085628.1 ATP-binding protein [Peptoniphilaceae bacterium]